MKVILENLDTPNKNNRIYSKECITNAIEKSRSDTVLVYLNQTSNPRLQDAAGVVNEVKIENNQVVADIQILSSPSGMVLKDTLLNNSVGWNMVGVGRLQTNKDNQQIVTDYRIEYINANPT